MGVRVTLEETCHTCEPTGLTAAAGAMLSDSDANVYQVCTMDEDSCLPSMYLCCRLSRQWQRLSAEHVLKQVQKDNCCGSEMLIGDEVVSIVPIC